jgi:adenylate kinase
MGPNVVMMGPPGAGKGTQAARLARARGVPAISTGDMMREAVKAGSPMGLAAKRSMDAGELVDDETMIGIVRDRLLRPDTAAGFVLDGFPRTVVQAKALDRIMGDRGKGGLVVVDVVVPEDELVRRLAGRRICAACGTNADPAQHGAVCARCGGALVTRADDRQEVVLERLRVYRRETAAVVDYYRERSTYCTVNGAQPPERVSSDISAVVDAMTDARPSPLDQGRPR